MSEVIQTETGPVSKPRKLPQQSLHASQIDDALLRLRTVQALVGLSKTSIYMLVSRQQFPQPIRRGTRCTRWRSADITAWLQAQGK